MRWFLNLSEADQAFVVQLGVVMIYAAAIVAVLLFVMGLWAGR